MTYAAIQRMFYEMTLTNSDSMVAANLNLYIQAAEDRVTSLILQADGRWQWDDTNNTDFPIGTYTLVSGQSDYSLATSHIRLLGVSIKDNAGLWHKLLPVDPDDFGDTDRAEYYKTAGQPLYYDKIGTSVVLYPPPDNGVTVTLASGGKFYFQRGSKHFDYTITNNGAYASYTAGMFSDSTGSYASVPGFNSLYHNLIPLWAAYNYCIIKLPQLATGYMTEILRLEKQLEIDYSKRDKDERNILKPKEIIFA